MEAIINDIQHFTRKKDGKVATKVSFDPIINKDKIILISPRWYEGELDEKKFKGKLAEIA